MSSPQVKFVLDAAWRRKWLLVLPPLLGLTAGWAVVQRLPKMYTASTTIVVQGPRVNEKLAETTITAGLEELLANIRPIIFSPDNLDPVARDIGMVEADASPREMEAARTALQRKIEITENARQANFTIAVTDESPKRAAKAANQIAKLFLDQYQSARAGLAGATVDYFAKEREEAAGELDVAERALAEFQRRNAEALPARVPGYQTRIGTLTQSNQQISEEIIAKEGQIALLKSQDRTDVTLSALAGTLPAGVEGAQRKLEQARAELADLLTKYSEQHPSVRLKREQLKKLEEEYAAQVDGGARNAEGSIDPPASPAEAQVRLLEQEIASLRARQSQNSAEIDRLYRAIDRSHFVDLEQRELQRVVDEARATYADLVSKERRSEQGFSLEESGQSTRLRVQTRAYAPSDPSSPVTANFLFGGAALGLLLGLGIAFLLEQLDPSLRTEERFRHSFPDVPLLESIPSLGPDPMTAKGKKGKGGKGLKPGKGKAAAAVAVAIVTGGLFS
jgi:polysaccharide chain length determinant protein (PEP-CTERM system associated)